MSSAVRAANTAWFRKSPPPVRIDEVPDVCVDFIEAGTLPDYVTVLPEQEYPLDTGKVSHPWARVSVWLQRRQEGSRSRDLSPTSRRGVCFGVRVEVAGDPERSGGWDYLRVMADLHDRVFEALNGREIGGRFRDETVAGVVLETVDVQPVYRVGFETPAPMWDEKSGVWVQVCEYQTVLERQPKEMT